MRGRNALHAFERLDATLRLACLGRLCAEAFDERFHVFDLALLARVHGRVLGHLGGPLIFVALMALVFQGVFTWATPLMDAIEGE